MKHGKQVFENPENHVFVSLKKQVFENLENKVCSGIKNKNRNICFQNMFFWVLGFPGHGKQKRMLGNMFSGFSEGFGGRRKENMFSNGFWGFSGPEKPKNLRIGRQALSRSNLKIETGNQNSES